VGGGGGLSRTAGEACEPLAQRYGEFLKALEGEEEVRGGGGVMLALLPPSLSLPLSVCVSVGVEACVFELCASSRAKAAASGASRTAAAAEAVGIARVEVKEVVLSALVYSAGGGGGVHGVREGGGGSTCDGSGSGESSGTREGGGSSVLHMNGKEYCLKVYICMYICKYI
jgi:hypothetical protein